MARKPTELELHLRESNTLDVPARQAALRAVDDMMRAATRSGELLSAARAASVQAAGNPNSPAMQSAAAFAREAYEQRTTAEVAKFRAAYAIFAEQNGEESVSAAQAARDAVSSQAQTPYIQAANYHSKVRDLMLQASAATAKALRSIPPLPLDVAPQARVGPEANVAQGGGEQLLAQPTYGWRPKKYSELMGNFYPMNYQLAAGALSGVHGTTAGGGQFGTADATQGMATGDGWWPALQRALGYGVKAAGQAASSEGQKVAGSDPAGGSALQVGGGVLNVLSAMLGVGVNDGMSGRATTQPEPATPWGTVLMVGGGLAAGGYLLWKLAK